MELRMKAIAFGALVALAACGGDDSSGPDVGYTGSKASVAITESNIGELAAQADAQVTGFAGYGYEDVTVIGAAKAGTADLVRKAIEKAAAARRDAGVAVTGAVMSISGPCDAGGSASITMNDGASPDLTEVGEYVQLSADACNDGYETVWGTIRIEITASPDGANPMDDPSLLGSGTYGMKLVVTDFVVESNATGDYMGIDGDVSLSLSWDASTYTLRSELSGTSLATQAGNGSAVTESSLLAGIPGVSAGYSFVAVEEFTDAYATTLAAEEVGIVARACSLEIGGCIDLEFDPALRKLADAVYPEAGTMRVTGANGAYFEIVVLDGFGGISLEYDVDGAGAADPVFVEYTTWDCLDQPGNVCEGPL